jgi:LacI family transcriptional regulator
MEDHQGVARLSPPISTPPVPPPTIADVARHCGVSVASVSNALSGTGRVSEKTRERVLMAAKKLGYSASPAARALRMQRSWSMGLVIPDIANPMFGQIARGAAEVLEEAGYHLLVASHDARPERQASQIRNLMRQRADGVILQPFSSDDDDVPLLARAGIPLVLLARHHIGQTTDFVTIDLRGPLLEGLSHLAALGHRRIAITLLGGRPSTTADERLAIYSGFMRDYVGAVDETLIIRMSHTDLEAGRAAAPALWRARATAVIVANDILALGVRDGLRALALSVPQDLSLLALEDTFLSPLPGIELTSPYLPKQKIGMAAARLILARIAEPSRAFETVVLPSPLVVRASTAPPRLSPP